MPLYMDRHSVEPGTPDGTEAIAQAHAQDLEIQSKYGVRYITYWYDPANANAFCLVDAPSPEAAEHVHREAHGQLANKIIPVDPGAVSRFLGAIYEPQLLEPYVASGIRTILMSDIVDSTVLVERLGDEHAVALLRGVESIVADRVASFGGRLVKRLGDGALASFESVVRGLDCALDIQRAVEQWPDGKDAAVRVRVGLSAGEPVEEDDDLFGAAVHLAARICGACPPGGVLVSSGVRDLAVGKGFEWEDHGETMLKGFEEAVRAFRLAGKRQP